MMWKIFVTGPFTTSLTFNVLLKNQKENNFLKLSNCRHLQNRDWFSKHILSFMKCNEPNCKSRSCSPFDFSYFRLKMTLFLCFLSLNLTITFSLFFMGWQAWRSSGVTVVPVKESAWHTSFSKSAKEIDWGIGLIYMVSYEHTERYLENCVLN